MTPVHRRPTLIEMRLSTTFDVSVPPDRVSAYLADPRHLLMANNRGPVVEQSDAPLAAGSWYVLAFDQLRVRGEYTVFDPPRAIAVQVAMTGRDSAGARSAQEFSLSAIDDGRGTRVAATAEGEGGPIRWAPILRASQALNWRRLKRAIETNG